MFVAASSLSHFVHSTYVKRSTVDESKFHLQRSEGKKNVRSSQSLLLPMPSQWACKKSEAVMAPDAFADKQGRGVTLVPQIFLQCDLNTWYPTSCLLTIK